MRRRFHISIIPNQPAGRKGPLFFISIFFLLALILAFSITLFVRLGSSNSVLVRNRDVDVLKEENRVLKKTEAGVKKIYDTTKEKVEELDKKAKRVEPLLGIQKMPEDKKLDLSDCLFSHRLDSLLKISKRNRDIFTYAYDKFVDNKRLSSSIPSIKPVEGWLIKGYGYINDLFTDELRFHPGVTFSAERGSAVYSTGDGSVIRKGIEDGLGLFVVINHNYGYITKYGHLQSVNVEEGEYVKRGDIIGYVGKTGRTTGPSLYYEVIMNGTQVDPLSFIFEDIETMEPKFNK